MSGDTHVDWLADGDRISKALYDLDVDLSNDKADRQYQKMVELYDKVASTPPTDSDGLVAQLRLVEREVVGNNTIPSWAKDALRSVLTTVALPTWGSTVMSGTIPQSMVDDLPTMERRFAELVAIHQGREDPDDAVGNQNFSESTALANLMLDPPARGLGDVATKLRPVLAVHLASPDLQDRITLHAARTSLELVTRLGGPAASPPEPAYELWHSGWQPTAP